MGKDEEREDGSKEKANWRRSWMSLALMEVERDPEGLDY